MSQALASEFTARNAAFREDVAVGEYDYAAPDARFRDITARLGLSASPVASTLAKHVGSKPVYFGDWANHLLAERARRAMEQLSQASIAAASTEAAAAGPDAPVAEFTSGLIANAAPSAPGAGAERVGEMIASVTDEAQLVARRTIKEMIGAIRHRRQTLQPLAKFVSKGATVFVGGGAERDAKPVFSTIKQLGALGLIASFAVTLVPHEAEARKRDRVMAILGGVAAGLVAPKVYDMMVNGHPQGGYGGAYPAPAYPSAGPVYPAPYPAYRPDPYAGSGYGATSYGAGRHTGPIPMSDQMTLAAKATVAISVGSVRRADAIVDQATQQGMACVRRFGPESRCLIQTQGVVMDFGRGAFTATLRGNVIAHEANGLFSSDNRILRGVWDEAKQIKLAEDGYGRRPMPRY
ncbi:hypothetical protein [Bosea sp. RAC05]|uniref:hypothetical protein n=1 Tax=Bosea sp. RAC05 TaxID=1842539 RepID=UPI00085753BA|nr:hypothetical protein [Bosea sp. RAC05]AOG03431.1 hypothetical protein BSY19_5332 [Bosea sp. RAC05]